MGRSQAKAARNYLSSTKDDPERRCTGVMKTPVLAPETHEFLAELHPVGRLSFPPA
jgi:hypothetical protein